MSCLSHLGQCDGSSSLPSGWLCAHPQLPGVSGRKASGCPGIHHSAGRMQEWGAWPVAPGQMSKGQSAPITVDLDCSHCWNWRLS